MGLRCLLVGAGAVLLSAAATTVADPIQFKHYLTDAEMLADLGPHRVAVAEGRMGNNALNGDFELDLGPDTSAPAVTRQRVWTNGQAVPFVLAYNPLIDQLTFLVGTELMVWSQPSDITELYFRAASTKAGASVTLSDLDLTGQALGVTVAANGVDKDLLRVRSASLVDGFVLTGDATFAWDPANRPLRSHLAFQIKMGSAPLVVPLPPAALGGLVLLAGLATVRFVRARR